MSVDKTPKRLQNKTIAIPVTKTIARDRARFGIRGISVARQTARATARAKDIPIDRDIASGRIFNIARENKMPNAARYLPD